MDRRGMARKIASVRELRRLTKERAPDYIVDVIREARRISFRISPEDEDEDEMSEAEVSRRRRIWEKVDYLKEYCKHMLPAEVAQALNEEWEFLDFTLMLQKFERGEDVRELRDDGLLNNRFVRLLMDLDYISKIGSALENVAVFKPDSGYTVPIRNLCEKYGVSHGKLFALKVHDIFYREGSETRGRYGLTEKSKKVLRALEYEKRFYPQIL